LDEILISASHNVLTRSTLITCVMGVTFENVYRRVSS